MNIVKKLFLFVLFAAVSTTLTHGQENENLKLWYSKPAQLWDQALPLGNGRLGAMVFGGVGLDHYQLNDNTLWSGFPKDDSNPDGQRYLPQVREAIFNKDYNKAADLWKKMQGPYSARYLTMGDLWLDFGKQETSKYYRELNLANAVSTVSCTASGTQYTKESFISHPDRVMVVRLSADKKGSINFSAALNSKLKFRVKALSDNYLVLEGKAPKFVAHRSNEPEQVVYDDWNGEGMNFEIHLKIKLNGGKSNIEGDKLVISGANEAVLLLASGTSFNGFDKSPGFAGKNPAIEPKEILARADKKSYAALKSAHIQDFQRLFNRVSFSLPYNQALLLKPVDERLQALRDTSVNDLHLQMLYYQLGRYLMISSSRPGSRPTNLQGIWNDHVQPPWGSNYTTNINTEMNYWPAEVTNLSECHQPLFNFMEELAINGAKTAKINYGIDEGWVTHHNSDLWAKTSPPGNYDKDPRSMPNWSAWPMAGAWFCQHLWQHYQFTGDKQFLKNKAYPLMKGASLFMLNWLVKDNETGLLVTNPSSSPENTIKIEGAQYQLTKASTMDMSLIRELFTNTIRTAELLNVDKETYILKLKAALPKLYPFHIGQNGQLQEWYGDWDDPKDKHRHISHLFALYPGDQITLQQRPELAAAAKQTLIFRGDESTGWSMAWKINWWARLLDGNHAYKMILSGLNYIDPTEKGTGKGGIYPNMFDACPPFQIDGNFGFPAGVTEMLMQSHAGEINLLPALPDAWPSGEIKGIKARGNFEVAVNWEKGKLKTAKITSHLGGYCKVRTDVPVKVLGAKLLSAEEEKSNPLMVSSYNFTHKSAVPADKLQKLNQLGAHTASFLTEKGKTYTIVAAEDTK